MHKLETLQSKNEKMTFEEEFPNAPKSILQYYPSVREYMEKHCIHKKRLKKIIESHSRKDVRHYEDSWDIRPSNLIEEMEL